MSMSTFFQQNWPHYWKRKMRWLFEIPAGHWMDCSSSWYKASLMGDHKKRGQHFFFVPPVYWGTADCCVILHVLSWCLMDFFFFWLSIMLLTLLWWGDREFCAHFRRGTALCKSYFPCQARVWMWRSVAAPLASCIVHIDCFLFLIAQ